MPPYSSITDLGRFPVSFIHRNDDFTYTEPETDFFRKNSDSMALRDFAVYAESERLASLLGGGFLRNEAVLPLQGHLQYSPGGGAVVQRAEATGNNRIATGRAFRAAVFSPTTAVLGFGMMREDALGAIQAGNGFPIMAGKALYFLLSAGVTADPQTVRTPMTGAHLSTYIEELSGHLVDRLAELLPGHLTMGDEVRKRALKGKLIREAQAQFLPDNKGVDKHTFVPWPKQTREGLVDYLLNQAGTHLTLEGPPTEREGPVQIPGVEEGQRKELKDSLSDKGWDLLCRMRAIEFANHIIRVGHQYTFINVEDSRGQDLPLVLGMLRAASIEATIWSDDMQGTGVIIGSGTLTWARKEQYATNDPTAPLRGIKVLITGAGAGAYGVYQELRHLGVADENILVMDSGPKKKRNGEVFAIYEGRTDIQGDELKRTMSKGISSDVDVMEWTKGAHVWINLADANVLTRDQGWTERIVRRMSDRGLFCFTTNPDPGIRPEWLKRVKSQAHYSSGNQMFSNTMNNFTAFGYIGLGAMLAGATTVNKEMTVAAMEAIHRVALMDVPDHIKKQGEVAVSEYREKWNLVPDPLDIRLIEEQSVAVALAAARSGVSIYFGQNHTDAQLTHFEQWLKREARLVRKRVEEIRKSLPGKAERYFKEHYPELFAPLTLGNGNGLPVYWAVPENSKNHFIQFSSEIGVEEGRKNRMLSDGNLDPRKLTEVLQELNRRSQGETPLHQLAQRELRIIIDIATLNPAMGLALGVRRLQLWDQSVEHLAEKPTLFHENGIANIVSRIVPKAEGTISQFIEEATSQVSDRKVMRKSAGEALRAIARQKAYEKAYKSNYEALSKAEGRSYHAASIGGMFAWELVSAFIHAGDVRTNLLRSAVGLTEFMALDHGWKFLLRRNPLVSLLAPALASATISVGTDVATDGLDSLTQWDTWRRAGTHAFTGGLVFVGGSRIMGNITQRSLATGIKGYIKPVVGNLAVGITSFTSIGAGSLASQGVSHLFGAGDHRIGVQA